MLGVIIGSAIMDCDHQYAPMAFIPLWRIVKHRRETHSIFFALVTSGLLTVVHPLMGVGNMIGCLLHLFGDWTTYYGQLDGLPCLWFPFNVIREKDKNIAA